MRLEIFRQRARLNPIDDPFELMYEDNVGQLDFGPGDRQGLAVLGQGECS